MSKRQPTAAQARYHVRFKTHGVPDFAPKSQSRFNRMWLGKAMAFVAVFSFIFSSVAPVQAVSSFVEVCHKTGNGYNSLSVNSNALQAHLDHGDVYPVPQGGCATLQPPVIPSTTIVVTGDTAAAENTPGWLFNRDTSTDTPYLFNSGNSSIGSGSLNVLPIGANAADKMVAENFINTHIADVTSISYDFKIGPNGLATQEEQFYMNVYANFGSSDDLKFYDCRYNVVPTVGSTGGFTTVSFDPTQAYPVTTRTGASASPFACPAVPAEMDNFSAGSNIRMFALNVGDTSASDFGLDGFLDKVVVSTSAMITTYDFEPAPPRTPIRLNVEKVWQDANGNPVEAPSNKDDITITVTEPDQDTRTCTYNSNGNLECSNTIYGYSDQTFKIQETGLPAGWTVVPTTVGDITPVCPESPLDGEKVVTCTATVINKMNTVQPCSLELVVNGGFELPEVTDEQKWQLFPSGTPGMGWSVDEVNSNTNANMELQEGVFNWKAHGGNQFLELDSDKVTKIYQDLITKVGGVYTVKLWSSPRPGQPTADNQTEVKMGNTVLELITADGTGLSQTVWAEHTYTFTATQSVTRLQITDKGINNSLGGFVDDVSVKEDCISDVTICKLDNNQAPLSGWNVFLKGDKLETVNVPANDVDGVATANPLEAGQDYLFIASGTADAGDSIEFDADYSFRTGSSTTWTDSVSTYEGLGDQLLDLQVNGGSVNWDDNSTYNTNHKYNYNFSGNGSTVTFRVNDTFPSNNNGSLSVDIYPVFKATTGESGCVILADVPYGSYKLDELMQDGWVNISGQNTSAVVDQPTESFTLVNKCTKACESQVKVCKLNDANDQGLPGWTVFLKGKLVETVQVNSATATGGSTTASLDSGKQYLVVASGEWSNRAGEKVDSKFTTMNNWTNQLDAPQGGYAEELLELQVNDSFVEWGPYDTSHSYNYLMTGNGATAKFRVYDFPDQSSADSSNGVWFGDNNGTLTVKIYEVYSGVTGSDGCVTLVDVPYGTYDLGEIMQDGWENEYGVDVDMVVNSPVEGPANDQTPVQFTLINACVDGKKCQIPTPQPCVDKPINNVFSGSNTEFLSLKEGTAPTALYDASTYGSGTPGMAVSVGPTGYAGAWDGAINNSLVDDAKYVSNDATQPTNSGGTGFNGSVDSWRLFSHTFQIPVGAINISVPSLHFAADNEVSVYLDAAITPLSSSTSFNSITSVSLGALTPGVHVLKFAVKNYAFDQTNNPTGVIYQLDEITYDCNTDPGNDNNPNNDVRGLVYLDSNNNGDNNDEPALPGMTVKLIKVTDPNPEVDGSELTETESGTDVSDSNGYYEFLDVPNGCYIVRELPDSYTITEPSNASKEYYINVGNSDCDFDGNEASLFSSLFVKTAQAAADTQPFVAYVGQDLTFGNFDNGQGGNGGSGGSSSSTSGSGSRPNGDSGTVAGDSTNTPSDSGSVLGAVTELPRTGLPISLVITLVAALAAAVVPKSLKLK